MATRYPGESDQSFANRVRNNGNCGPTILGYLIFYPLGYLLGCLANLFKSAKVKAKKEAEKQAILVKNAEFQKKWPAILPPLEASPNRRSGVAVVTINDKATKIAGLSEQSGVIVMGVNQDSVAFKAGMRQNDVILQYGDRKIIDIHDMTDAIVEDKRDTVPVIYWRNRGRVAVNFRYSQG
jgi:hypothetical protein